ncbi:MAG: bifunctional aminoglycoside phosphotransferase/ATP-binding protein [Wenzhouxiangella sp.]
MHSELIDALMNPACYPHSAERVERVETHISWVLLVGDYAYKIKKPVDFGFLDFSSLARRKHFCHEELRLNRRHAASIYLDVVTITGMPSAPEIGGQGPVLEYAVRMRRFDQDLRFDRLLARQALRPEHIDQLALELAGLHAQADRAKPGSKPGSPEAVMAPMRDNFSSLERLRGDSSRLADLKRLSSWTERQFARLQARIEQRQADGHVRECHGDAHLANVVLHQGRATLFDCLEFSPELRWTDTMADLAFTVMDLLDRGAEDLSWRLLDVYLSASGDYAGLELLDFYLVYRAMVRAKVGALSFADAAAESGAEAKLERLACEVDGYLALARHTAQRPRALLIVTAGVSGSGKSFLSERLLARCGMIRLRSDVERKRLQGLAAGARTDSAPGAGLYTAAISARTYRHLAELSERLLAIGLPVLVDAACLQPEQRELFRAVARRMKLPFGVLHCHAPQAVLAARVSARERDGRDPSEAGLAVLHAQLAGLDTASLAGEEQVLVLDTSQTPAIDRAAAWIEALRSGRGVDALL